MLEYFIEWVGFTPITKLERDMLIVLSLVVIVGSIATWRASK